MLKLILKSILFIAVMTLATGCQKKSSRTPVQSKDGPGAQGPNNGSDSTLPPQAGGNSSGNKSSGDGSKFAGTGGKPRTGGPAVQDIASLDPRNIDVEATSTTPGMVKSKSYGDYLWNPPGLPFPAATTPILTGGETEREYKATDANDDTLMAYLVTLANEDRENFKEFGENSLKLAAAVSDVDARIDRSNGNIEVSVGIKSGEREYIIPFSGRLTANRRAVLDNVRAKTTYEEIDRKREKQYRERKFRLTLACVDRTTGCTSVIMRMDQLFLKEGAVRSKDTPESDWVLCRSVYALARVGNVHIQIDENDYINYKSYANLNRNHYEFVRMLANSAHYVRYKTKSLQSLDRTHTNRPRLHNATMDFFAVAYGFARFKIKLHSAAPLNSEGVLVSRTTTLPGPMLWASSRIANDNDMLAYDTQHFPGSLNYADMIDTAKLVENDGRGQIGIVFNFKGLPEMSTQVNFTTLFAETIDPLEQRNGLKDEQQVYTREGQPEAMADYPPREMK